MKVWSTLGSLSMNFFLCLETEFHSIIFSLGCQIQEDTCQVEVVKATAQKFGDCYRIWSERTCFLTWMEGHIFLMPVHRSLPTLPTPLKTTTHNNQRANMWKQTKYRSGHCGFTISTTKWERKRQCVFHKTKFIFISKSISKSYFKSQFKWFWDYVLTFWVLKCLFSYVMMLRADSTLDLSILVVHP